MRPEPFYYAASFGLVLYLVGKGYEPLRAELSRDGTGKILYVFPIIARAEFDGFYALKDRLNEMGLAAQRSTHPTRVGDTPHVRPADQQ